MRRLCLTVVAMSAMLALPVWAQQGTDETRDGANAPDDSTSATVSTAETTNAVPPLSLIHISIGA